MLAAFVMNLPFDLRSKESHRSQSSLKMPIEETRESSTNHNSEHLPNGRVRNAHILSAQGNASESTWQLHLRARCIAALHR